MSNKIVHFETGKTGPGYTGDCKVTLCEWWLCDKPENMNKLTRDKEKVTCPDCLDKLGLKQKPEVDEEKKRWAEFVIKHHIFYLPGSEKIKCRGCQDASSRPVVFSCNIDHKKNCIVLSAQQYLESLEAPT